MRSRVTGNVALVPVFISLIWASSVGQNPRELYQRARLLDESNQNRAEAIRLYNQVISLAKNDRALTANAQYQIGVVYERVGRTRQAQQAYKVVVTQYPDQIAVADRARARLAAMGANGKKAPKFVVKESGPSPDGRFMATLTFPAQLVSYVVRFALDSDHKRLYGVTNRFRPLAMDPASKRALERGLQQVYEPSTLVVVDTAANSVVKTLTLDSFIGGLAFNPATNKLYGNATADGHVKVIDVITFAQVTIPIDGYPGLIAVDPSTNKIYACSQGFSGNDKVFVIDGSSNTVLMSLNLDGVTGGAALVLNSATNRLYATTGDPAKTRVFNLADGALVTDLARLQVLAADPSRNKLFASLVSDQGAQTGFAILDGNTHEVLAKPAVIPAGSIGVNPTTGRAYVPHSDTRSVSIIDVNANTETSRFSLAKSVHAINVDPTTGRIYALSSNPLVLGVIDKDTLEEEAPEEFVEEFAEPSLDPAWVIIKGEGSYSLSENPGQLRFRVGRSHVRGQVLLLFRGFQGESWILETKLSYFMGITGGVRDLDLTVAFGKRPPRESPTPSVGDPDRVVIRRHRGDWNGCCPGTNGVLFFDNVTTSSDEIPPNSADAYVWRIRRNSRTIVVERSDDGINFLTVGTHTFGPQIDGLIQYVGLTYANSQNNDAYADYDYLRLQRIAR